MPRNDLTPAFQALFVAKQIAIEEYGAAINHIALANQSLACLTLMHRYRQVF
jgi:hypothetical protein